MSELSEPDFSLELPQAVRLVTNAVTVSNDKLNYSVTVFVPNTSEKFNEVCNLKDAKTGEDLEISNEGVIKSYDMSAIGITFEKMYHIIDKERNGY